MSNKNQAKTAEIFDQIASSYEANCAIQNDVAKRLIDRLDFIPYEANIILDAGCGTGHHLKKLAQHYPKAKISGIDLSEEMLKIAKKQGGWFAKQKLSNQDMCHTLIDDNSIDFIFSNLALPWVTDIDACFSEWQRILKPGGLLLFSTFGPDTLKQIKKSWASIEPKHKMMNFIDMHNIGDALLSCGLSEPVMDVEKISNNYASVKDLIEELKSNGNFSFLSENQNLRPDQKLIEAMQHFIEEQNPTHDDIEITWEVIYGHAWGSEIQNSKLNDDTFKLAL